MGGSAPVGLLRSLFGPSKAEVWPRLADAVGGRFVAGGFFGNDYVQAAVPPDWTVTLDTYTVSTGKSTVTFTRLRAPFVNRDRFRMKIYRAGVLSELGRLLGFRD